VAGLATLRTGNGVGHNNIFHRRRAVGLVTHLAGLPFRNLSRLLRPTQPLHG